MKFHALWASLGWLLVALVVYGSLTPSPPEAPMFEQADKLMHGLAYLVLMIWFGQLHSAGQRPWIALALVGLGVALELLQGAGGERMASWMDGVANAAGVACGWLVLRTRLGTVLAWLDAKMRRAAAL